jgi:hypothetical protein
MVIEDQTLDIPPDETVIWRYMDLAKFIDLLHRSSLFFCRADSLTDTWEGSFTASELMGREKILREESLPDDDLRWLPESKRHQARHEIDAMREKLRQVSTRVLEQLRTGWCVNCWAISPVESAALWSLYVPTGVGVAVQSTVGCLKAALRDNKEPIAICRVRYIDFDKDEMPDNLLGNMMCKRKEFEYEQELRAVVRTQWQPADRRVPGCLVPVKVNELLGRIAIAPGSQRWYSELVAAILEKWRLSVEIRTSSLDRQPRW